MTHSGTDSTQTPPPASAARWRLRGGWLDLAAPQVMAICNVTPDSFSDGGEHYSVTLALDFARHAQQQGAHILDIGGESTRPGATPVSAERELDRVLPVIEAVREQLPDLLMSIDTVKSTVADAALAAGAHIVNDVSGGRLDPAILDVAARHGAGVVLMHSRGGVGDMASYAHANYDRPVIDVVCDELHARVQAARHAGVPADAIVLDPGLGFSKTAAQSLRVLHDLSQLVALGYPVLAGASRKRFVGEVTGVSEPSQRVTGSAVAHLLAVQGGARVVRTHDVAATREALAMLAAVRDANA